MALRWLAQCGIKDRILGGRKISRKTIALFTTWQISSCAKLIKFIEAISQRIDAGPQRTFSHLRMSGIKNDYEPESGWR